MLTPDIRKKAEELIHSIDELVANPNDQQVNSLFQEKMQDLQQATGPIEDNLKKVLLERLDLVRDVGFNSGEETADYSSRLDAVASVAADLILSNAVDSMLDTEGMQQLVTALVRQGVPTETIQETDLARLEIPEEDSSSIIQNAEKLFHKGITSKSIEQILSTLREISIEERASVIQNSKKLIQPDMNGLEVSSILLAVKSIPTEERESAIENTQRFIQEGMKGGLIGGIVLAQKEIQEEEMESVIQISRKILRNEMDGVSVKNVLLSVIRIPIEERADIIEHTQKLIPKTMVLRGISGHVVGEVLHVFHEMEESIREPARNIGHQWIRQGMPGSLLKDIMTIVSQMPHAKREDHKEVQKAIKERIYAYITELLEDEENAPKIREISDFVTNHQDLVGILDEDPLVDLLIRAQLEIDPSIRGTDNIYAVHAELLEKAQEAVSPNVACIMAEDELREFNYKPFFAIIKVQEVPVFFGDLPDVPLDIFQTSFADLEIRRQELEETEKNRLDQEIEFYGSLERLRNGCCSPETRISYWMNHPRKAAKKTAPRMMKEVYTLAQELQGASNELQTGDPLTPKERILVAIASQVTSCQSGQEGGIHAAYNLSSNKPKAEAGEAEVAESPASLPLTPAAAAEYDALIELKQQMIPLLRKQKSIIDNMLSFDGPLMKELVPKQSSRKELVHQERYLKNLLKEDLALDHTVRIDLHAGCIDKDLRKKSKEEILQVFYRHYVGHLIAEVETKMNEIAQQNFSMLSSALGTLPEEALTFDDNSFQITFTRKGAVLCLEALGLLRKGIAPPV